MIAQLSGWDQLNQRYCDLAEVYFLYLYLWVDKKFLHHARLSAVIVFNIIEANIISTTTHIHILDAV